jgi:site-specific DNA-methyltransferase (adenine-specific)
MINLYNQDCREVMAGIESGSIDLILTDPPYYSTKLEFDKAERIDYKQWLLECQRILKLDGILISFADFNLLAELRGHKVFKSTYELIWEKTMAVGFLDANIRPLRNHEYIGIFTDAFKESTYNPQKTKGDSYKIERKNATRIEHTNQIRTSSINNGDRHPLSVLSFSNGNNGSLHPTQKPLDLVSWLIKSYSNENDVIFDPFMGSGTTGHAASLLNRNFIGCELNETFYSIAKERIEDAEHDLLNYFGEF